MKPEPKVLRRLIRALVPAGSRSALRRVARRRLGGLPFPFTVSSPQSRTTLNCCVAYNKHGAYCVPVSGLHRPAAQRVLAGDVWEASTLDFMTSQCGSGDVVHAGTFFGDFLPALASAVRQDARVWAFEPNPESYRCASVTIGLNRLSNVELTNAGLGEQQHRKLLLTYDCNGTALGGASRIADEEQEQGAASNHAVPISMVTIDGAVPESRRVFIIQLDVEGYEERALLGAMRTIRRCRPILILETAPKERFASEHLRPLGYRITGSVSNNVILRCD